MAKYLVEYKYVLKGSVIVEADSKEEANDGYDRFINPVQEEPVRWFKPKIKKI